MIFESSESLRQSPSGMKPEPGLQPVGGEVGATATASDGKLNTRLIAQITATRLLSENILAMACSNFCILLLRYSILIPKITSIIWKIQ